MSEEKKTLTLADFGLDVEDTPAEKAEKEHKVVNQNGNKISIIDHRHDKPKTEDVKHNQNKIITPHNKETKHHELKADSNAFLREINSANSETLIKKDGQKYKDKIQHNRDDLALKVDKNIKRVKGELVSRIKEGKEKLVCEKYDRLYALAETREDIKQVLTDAEKFLKNHKKTRSLTPDQIDYKALILYYTLQHQELNLDPNFFGTRKKAYNDEVMVVTEDRKTHKPVQHKEIVKYDGVEYEDIVEEDFIADVVRDMRKEIMEELNPDDDLSEETLDKVPRKPISVVEKEEEKKPEAIKDILEKDEEVVSPDYLEISDDEPDEEAHDEEPTEDDSTDEDPQEKINDVKDAAQSAIDQIGIKPRTLAGFTIASKPIKINTALNAQPKRKAKSVLWALPNTGTSAYFTPLSGEDIYSLRSTDYESLVGITKTLTIIYNHINFVKRPEFEVWLRNISVDDFVHLCFGMFYATFDSTNIISYECPNQSCGKIFVENKPMKDCYSFPNKSSEERFNEIMSKEPVEPEIYKSTPVVINDYYAFGLTGLSLFSQLLEPLSLPKEFSQKYPTTIDLLKNIDKVYAIDQAKRTLTPIDFGIPKEKPTLSTITQRKVKGLHRILKYLTSDERGVLLAEALRVNTRKIKDEDIDISYHIPGTICPKCGTAIPPKEANPLSLLFTRAQLPTEAIYYKEQ